MAPAAGSAAAARTSSTDNGSSRIPASLITVTMPSYRHFAGTAQGRAVRAVRARGRSG